ncbi:MAG: OmpA family protein [Bdellovibrio sp.]|nr:OmpA family protein [Bdellovibrio sp.]
MKLVLIMFLISISALARESDQFGLGFGLGPSMITNPSSLEDPAGLGVAGGFWGKYTVNERLILDLSYHRLDFSKITTYANSLSIGGSYLFMTEEKFNPYGHFGIGAGTIPHNNRDSSGQIELMSKIGLGVEYKLSPEWMATFQADFHAFIPIGQNKSQLYSLAPLFGITYYWERAYTAAVPCIVQPPVKTITSAIQRPIIEDIDEPILQAESQPPAKIQIQSKAKSEKKLTEKKLTKINVKFYAGKKTFTHYYHDQLSKAAQILKKDKKMKVIISGHADKSGSRKLNDALAKARAEAVRSYLVDKLKVDPDDVIVKAYGTSRPEASNRDPAGRSANRRVEAQFVEIVTD